MPVYAKHTYDWHVLLKCWFRLPRAESDSAGTAVGNCGGWKPLKPYPAGTLQGAIYGAHVFTLEYVLPVIALSSSSGAGLLSVFIITRIGFILAEGTFP